MAVQRKIEHFNLRSKLKFNMDEGQIWLGESRMLLLHAKALGALRRELFDSLGAKQAQGLLFRMGFAAGQQDADLASKLLVDDNNDNYDVFQVGPELHAFEGLVKASITNANIDWENGCFLGETKCENSWEAESHLQYFGIGEDTACWSLSGYASGYASRFFRRFIVFRETQCVCQGATHCTMLGKPIESWGDDGYFDYYQPQDFSPSLQELQRELWKLRGGQREALPTGKLVGNSLAFRMSFELLSKAAKTPITVLLLGETGVGKEVFAQWLHENSDRAKEPFIAVNCAAIPNDLIESELFGVQKGAFTGAQQSRPGRFERADGGTLFLDELGDLSPSAQVKLLRVLQTGEVERLGDNKTKKVNVRLIAATNINLRQAIDDGHFRADLYYRLATYPVAIPPLRERKSDIPLLVTALLEKYAPVYKKTFQGLTDRAMQALLDYNWPGNVRELENLIERAVLLVPSGEKIEVSHLFSNTTQLGTTINNNGQLGCADEMRLEQLYETILDENFNLQIHEDKLFRLAVQRSNGNLTHAAKLLGITRRQLSYRLKQIGIDDLPPYE